MLVVGLGEWPGKKINNKIKWKIQRQNWVNDKKKEKRKKEKGKDTKTKYKDKSYNIINCHTNLLKYQWFTCIYY